MVQVGIVRVLVYQALVTVPVRVRFARLIARRVPVLVMLVVNVGVFVLQRFVLVIVFVPLDKVKVEPDAHQQRRQQKPPGDRLGEHEEGQQRADEGRVEK